MNRYLQPTFWIPRFAKVLHFRTLQTAFRTPKRPPKRVFFTFFSSSTDPWTVRHIFKVFQNFTCFFTDPIPGYHIFDLFFENLTQNMIPRYRTAQKTLKILKNVKNMTPRSRICCRPEKSEKNRKKRVLGLFGPPNGLRTPQTAFRTPKRPSGPPPGPNSSPGTSRDSKTVWKPLLN